MGQNRYRLFEKNDCIEIEQSIETLHNLIVPEQLRRVLAVPFISIEYLYVFYGLYKYVGFWLNLN